MEITSLFKTREEKNAFVIGIIIAVAFIAPALYWWADKYAYDSKNVEIRKTKEIVNKKNDTIEKLYISVEKKEKEIESIKEELEKKENYATSTYLYAQNKIKENRELYLSILISDENLMPLNFRDIPLGTKLDSLENKYPLMVKEEDEFYSVEFNDINKSHPFSDAFFYFDGDELYSVMFLIGDNGLQVSDYEALVETIRKNVPSDRIVEPTSRFQPMKVFNKDRSQCVEISDGAYHVQGRC